MWAIMALTGALYATSAWALTGESSSDFPSVNLGSIDLTNPTSIGNLGSTITIPFFVYSGMQVGKLWAFSARTMWPLLFSCYSR